MLQAVPAVTRELEVPAEIAEALEHRVPQALLRDLHRPELEEPHLAFDVTDVPRVADAFAELAEARALVARRGVPR
jgi:hypothetical protein